MLIERKEGILRVCGEIVDCDLSVFGYFAYRVPSNFMHPPALKDALNTVLWKAPLVRFNGAWIKQFRTDAALHINKCRDGWMWGVDVGDSYLVRSEVFKNHTDAEHDFELHFTNRPLESGPNWWLFVNNGLASLVENTDRGVLLNGRLIYTSLNAAKVSAIRLVGLQPWYHDVTIDGERVYFS